ncbi:MAG TPA: endolytic transglycosylase MltG, partial [Candidatus Obscuribacterales bacterium]
MQRITRTLFYILILPATLALGGWQGWAWWSWATAPALSSSDPSLTADDSLIRMDIPSGTSARQIGQDLKAVGLIRSTTAWDLWARWQMLRDRPGGFLAGTYELSPTTPMVAIADQIWDGEVATQQFTIPEGWSIQQMAAYFEA